jgi:hypothetical protein
MSGPTCTTKKAEDLRDALREWSSVSERYADFGATDTEPRAVLRWFVKHLLRGNNPEVSKLNWQLYDASMDCTEAANALNGAAEKIKQVVDDTSISDLKSLVAVAEYYYGGGCCDL